MKYLLSVLLMAVTLPLIADDQVNSVLINDFDRVQHGFSFSKGSLVDVSPGGGCPLKVDFIFDNALGMNNKELAHFFSGSGEIVDLGPGNLDDETEIPESGFIMAVDIEDLIPGHVFLIRTADKQGYGKIQINSLSEEEDVLGFNWVSLE